MAASIVSEPTSVHLDDVDAEIARNLWKHHRMLPPGSRFRQKWDYFMMVLVLYNTILTPMQVRPP